MADKSYKYLGTSVSSVTFREGKSVTFHPGKTYALPDNHLVQAMVCNKFLEELPLPVTPKVTAKPATKKVEDKA